MTRATPRAPGTAPTATRDAGSPTRGRSWMWPSWQRRRAARRRRRPPRRARCSPASPRRTRSAASRWAVAPARRPSRRPGARPPSRARRRRRRETARAAHRAQGLGAVRVRGHRRPATERCSAPSTSARGVRRERIQPLIHDPFRKPAYFTYAAQMRPTQRIAAHSSHPDHKETRRFQRVGESLLPNSNRRPLPYHWRSGHRGEPPCDEQSRSVAVIALCSEVAGTRTVRHLLYPPSTRDLSTLELDLRGTPSTIRRPLDGINGRRRTGTRGTHLGELSSSSWIASHENKMACWFGFRHPRWRDLRD